jgi:hypothetical protein
MHFTGENSPPIWDTNVKLNAGYSLLERSDDSYMRLPLWMLEIDWFGADTGRIINPKPIPIDCVKAISEAEKPAHQDRFCAFVVTNPLNSIRNESFFWLSSYKQVDSAGRLFNNIGDEIFAGRGGGGGIAGSITPTAAPGAGGSGIVIVRELNQASGVWNLKSQFSAVKSGTWPEVGYNLDYLVVAGGGGGGRADDAGGGAGAGGYRTSFPGGPQLSISGYVYCKYILRIYESKRANYYYNFVCYLQSNDVRSYVVNYSSKSFVSSCIIISSSCSTTVLSPGFDCRGIAL